MSASKPVRSATTAHRRSPGEAARLRMRLIVFRLLERSERAHGASWLVDMFLVIVIFINVAAVLLQSVSTIGEAYANEFRVLEVISVAIFSLEYVLRIWSCVEDTSGDPTGSALGRRLRFALSPMALIDLCAVLPFYLAAVGLLGPADTRILRVLRLLRLFKLTRYATSISLLGQVLRENAANFVAALGVLLVVMVFAASGMYLLERNVQPEEFGDIPSAMWWAFVTLTTVGYGDVTPVTTLGKVFASAIIAVSIGIVALPAGLLASSFSARLRNSADAYRTVADQAVSDGIITDDERLALDRKRRELGLGEDLAEDILESEQTRRFYHDRGVCPHCGQHLARTQSADA